MTDFHALETEIAPYALPREWHIDKTPRPSLPGQKRDAEVKPSSAASSGKCTPFTCVRMRESRSVHSAVTGREGGSV